jgi:hypothetical protein
MTRKGTAIQRAYQILFVFSLLVLSWLGMMAVHELGHVLGAVLTGGVVERVVLHPLSISRTDVSPNPHPAIVVWLGPLVGVLLPLVCVVLVSRRWITMAHVVRFFAGFCLVTNGAYISFGSFAKIGDCGEMLRTGSPLWAMLMFGASCMAGGIYLWHGMGSLANFWRRPELVTPKMAYTACGILLVAIVTTTTLSTTTLSS